MLPLGSIDPLTTPLKPSPHAVESRLGDETVILHLESGTYFGLDGLGTRIWEQLKRGGDQQAICAAIAEEFDVTPAQVEADARLFLDQLLEHAILQAA